LILLILLPVAAVKAANLVDTLKGAAPLPPSHQLDDAFAKLPAGTRRIALATFQTDEDPDVPCRFRKRQAADVVKLKFTVEGSTVKIDAANGVKVNDPQARHRLLSTTALSTSLTLCSLPACYKLLSE